MLRDRILIRKAKRGERQAFGLIYQKYRDTMLTVAMSLLADPELAQDVVQDVFVRFVESLDRFDLRGQLKGYLATCVANRARDQIRQKTRDDNVVQNGRGLSQARPLDVAIQNEQLHQLAKALAQLPYEQREVIALKVHGGLSFRAIARQRGIRLGTVQSRYRYALNRLQAQLNGKVKT
ncbi:MAG: sigma-70 family RNA polymerase sigma factor [Phycisphaerales bacterium]|nr:MAG: sigma-70 family RNA polymerase sigma factor [Phycisphaerales bacterium]